MHVGLILPAYGAAELQIPALSLLVEGLAGEIDVTVLPLRNPDGVELECACGADILAAGGAGLPFRALLRAAFRALRERHQTHPFDLLHGYWLFEPGLVAAAAARLLGIPSVASVGGAELTHLPDIGYGGSRAARGRLLHRAVLGSATLVTGGSSYILDLARQQMPASARKLRLAPLPVRSEVKPEPMENPFGGNSAFHLLQVGAYLPVKGQDLSIRALSTLRCERQDLTLTLIGENPLGYRERMRALSHALGVAGNVRLLERVPHGALAAYYHHSDLLLMPSRHESQGMVVLEAAAYGLPTVGADVGVVRDLAPEAASAFAVGDLDGLARAVRALLKDHDRRRLVGWSAQREVRNGYGVEPAIRRWLDVYQEARDGV